MINTNNNTLLSYSDIVTLEGDKDTLSDDVFLKTYIPSLSMFHEDIDKTFNTSWIKCVVLCICVSIIMSRVLLNQMWIQHYWIMVCVCVL